MTKRASYREAVLWIAYNDEDSLSPESLDIENVKWQLSVQLIADLWGKTNTEVAEAIIKERRAAERGAVRAREAST